MVIRQNDYVLSPIVYSGMVGKPYSRRTALKSGACILSGATLVGAASSTAAATDTGDWDWTNPIWDNQDDNVDLSVVEEGGQYDDNGILGEVTDGIEHYDFKQTSVTGTTVYEVPIVIESNGVLNDPNGDPMEYIDESWTTVQTTGDYPVSMDFSPNEHHMGSFTYANTPSDGTFIDSKFTETAIDVALAAASIKFPVLTPATIAADVIFSYEYNSNEGTYDFDAKWDYNYQHSDADRESQFSTWTCFFLKLEPSQQTTFEVNSGWRSYQYPGTPEIPYTDVTYEVTVTAPSSDELYPGSASVTRLS